MTSDEKVLSYLQKKYPLEKNTPEKPTTVIVLDGQHINHITEKIKNYLENFKDLDEITATFCNLSSLENLPDLPLLSKIELTDNHIKGTELTLLCKYKNLSELRIANNNGIKSFNEIKCLENLSKLKLLDFTDCPISKIDKYRDKMFENFKNLEILDGVDKNGKPVEEDDDNDEEDELEEDKEFIDDEKQEVEEELEEEGDDNDGEELKESEGEDNEKEEKEEEDEDDEYKKSKKYKSKNIV